MRVYFHTHFRHYPPKKSTYTPAGQIYRLWRGTTYRYWNYHNSQMVQVDLDYAAGELRVEEYVGPGPGI